MGRKIAVWAAVIVLGCEMACTQSDQERARRKAEELKQRTREEAARAGKEARKFGAEAKQEAKRLGRDVDGALNSKEAGSATKAAGEKLRSGARDLHAAGGNAAIQLDHAAIIAKVKAKLATDVGLSTVSSVTVDASGHVVTLHGTVASQAQREQAAESVRQVPGVTKVVNDLKVRPQITSPNTDDR